MAVFGPPAGNDSSCSGESDGEEIRQIAQLVALLGCLFFFGTEIV